MKKRVVSFVAAVAALASLANPGGSRAAESATRTSSVGPVTVAVTPLPPAAPGEPLRLKVVLDTHSVDLDGVAFERAVAVRSAGGEPVASPQVESTKGSGHHREAALVFPPAAAAGATALEGSPRPGTGGVGMMMGQGPMGHGMMGTRPHMMGMTQPMSGMLELLGDLSAAGRLSPEETKRLGEILRQMGAMMAEMHGVER